MSDPILTITLPFKVAFTMNELKGHSLRPKGHFVLKRAEKQLDNIIREEMRRQGVKGNCRVRRKAVVTRHTTKEPDELACDIIGGKMALDRLVHLGVLVDDSPEWLEREARFVRAKNGQGKVTVEIFECEAPKAVVVPDELRTRLETLAGENDVSLGDLLRALIAEAEAEEGAA